MKATDLRVGNLVLHNKQIFVVHDIISTQDSIIIGGLDVKDGLQEVFINEVEPVQLSEDRLLKCEFEKEDKHEYPHFFVINKGMRNEVCIENLNKNACFILRYGVKFSNIKLEHLHHLQNIYFTLTGKELDIRKLIRGN